MAKYDHLDGLQIAKPCGRDWDGMLGDEKTRYCEHCDKCVHDVAHMTRRETAALIKSQPSVCLRTRRDRDGKMIFKLAGFSALWAAAMAWMTMSGHKPNGDGNAVPDMIKSLMPHESTMMGDVAVTGKIAVPVKAEKTEKTASGA